MVYHDTPSISVDEIRFININSFVHVQNKRLRLRRKAFVDQFGCTWDLEGETELLRWVRTCAQGENVVSDA